mmetsp:Transcript_20579/g.45014  ORF Transcript_20579/g.45014 Transcript_20579/m.45014 type:complete len:278 (+) Transcript_20579:58-891(+)
MASSFWGLFSREATEFSVVDNGPQEHFSELEARIMEMLEMERRERRAAIEELWAHQQELIGMVRTCLQMRPAAGPVNGMEGMSKQHMLQQQYQEAQNSPVSSRGSDVWPSSPVGMTPEQELMQFIPSLARGTWSIRESTIEDGDADADSQASGSQVDNGAAWNLDGHPFADAAVPQTRENKPRGSSMDSVPEVQQDPIANLAARRQATATRKPFGSNGALGSMSGMSASNHSWQEGGYDRDDPGPSVSGQGTPRLSFKDLKPGSRFSGFLRKRQEQS